MKISQGLVALSAISGIFLAAARAQTTSFNSGSLGAAGNGTNSPGVVVGPPGAVAAGGDMAAYYTGGSVGSPVHTTVPYNPALNPPSTSPFTIEFWANPSAITDDAVGPAPLFNRVTSGNRSGWVFFQRSPATGWNFRMYDGNGSTVGFDLTGGTNAADTWSHVVVTWSGSSPIMYVNGTLADNTSTGSGIYNASNSAIFSIASYDDGNNPFSGAIDETAFYGSALTPAQILAHFNAASSAIPGAYSSLVVADGAIEYLRNIPEPTSLALLGLVGCSFAARRRRSA